jgi:hypothetical protein
VFKVLLGQRVTPEHKEFKALQERWEQPEQLEQRVLLGRKDLLALLEQMEPTEQ